MTVLAMIIDTVANINIIAMTIMCGVNSMNGMVIIILISSQLSAKQSTSYLV